MRKIAALVVLLAMPAHAGFIAPGFFESGFDEDGFFEESTPQVAVPDVVGEADSAAADMIFEMALLDLGPVTPHCSPEAADEVTDQTPPAGTLVPEGTLIAIGTSNGVLCKGFPPLWLYLETER